DGEQLTYNYNPVGQLKSIYSSENIAYLKDVKYTFFDQPYEILYGNDVKTINHYDDMQRIRTMQIDRPSGNTFLHTNYTYDRNQNIIRLENVASQHELIRMGGMFDKYYKYDKFNRLSNASGEWKGYEEIHSYNLDMYYNATHGIIKKDQYHYTENADFSGTTENSYDATYKYNFADHPHAPSQINYANGNVTEFQYDSNGNIIYLNSNSELIIHGERRFIWDEQNRLLAVDDNNGQTISHYIYDHTGERTFKSEGGLSHANIGGQQIYEIEDVYNYTIYPSGNIVVSPNRDEYTKHYYSNGKKIASKLARLENRFELSGGFQTQSEAQSNVAPVRKMATMSTSNDDNYCAQQLTTILNHYVGPQWAECRAFINSVILDHLEQPCVAVTILNQHYCEENPLQPAPDPTDPEYTPEEIIQFDCLNEL